MIIPGYGSWPETTRTRGATDVQDGDETSGRGLLLVESRSKDWGRRHRRRQDVWFEISTDAPEADVTELDEDALLAAFADVD